MPRISIDNYDTVASWNGSQDLFVVEQPDGTKVATPAMVKQFIETGDFEATGEIKDGHGNILKNMAKSADVDAEIGDLSQTGLTGDSVAEQLDTAREQIAGIKTKTSGLITPNSGYSIRLQNLVKVNGTVYGVFVINATNVISNRVTIGYIPSGFRPQINTCYFCPASDSINSFQNRATNVIITLGGEIIVGDIVVPAGQTIKEIFCAFAYNQGN